MKENLALKKKWRYIIFSQCIRVDYADVSVRSGQSYKRKKSSPQYYTFICLLLGISFWLYLYKSSLSPKIIHNGQP